MLPVGSLDSKPVLCSARSGTGQDVLVIFFPSNGLVVTLRDYLLPKTEEEEAGSTSVSAHGKRPSRRRGGRRQQRQQQAEEWTDFEAFQMPVAFPHTMKKQETGFGGFGLFSSAGGFGSSQQRLLEKLEHWHDQESTATTLVTQLCSDGKLVFLSGDREQSGAAQLSASLAISDDGSLPADACGCIDVLHLLDGAGGVFHRIPLPFAPVNAALVIPGDPSGGWILTAADGHMYQLQGGWEGDTEGVKEGSNWWWWWRRWWCGCGCVEEGGGVEKWSGGGKTQSS